MRCADCGLEKPEDEFPRNRRMRSGRHCYCKKCNNRRNRESLQRLFDGSSRHYHLRHRYGIAAEDVADLIEQQGGKCALCHERPATQVDHDHKTGRVRGILCLYCNAGMGAFRDDPDIIRGAIAYLRQGP